MANKKKVAVVTGSGRGIGREIALALAAEDVAVVINDLGTDDSGNRSADLVVKEIEAKGGTATANYDSVAELAGCERIVGTAIANFGRVDVVVNPAGNLISADLDELTEEAFDLSMAVHVKGHLGTTKAALPHMIEQGGGRIIMFASLAAFFANKYPAYASAKAAIMGMSSQLARSLARHNITVNCILPSAETLLFPEKTRGQAGYGRGSMARKPVPVSMDPERVPPMIVYLATSETAKTITGRFVYASGNDIMFYASPLINTDHNIVIRKDGDKWTTKDLEKVIPSLVSN